MIKSFRCANTQSFYENEAHFALVQRCESAARRKLRMLDAADSILDLRSPPGNHLEALKGNRKGQHSIRINDQYRICFVWRGGHAHHVEITDYH